MNLSASPNSCVLCAYFASSDNCSIIEMMGDDTLRRMLHVLASSSVGMNLSSSSQCSGRSPSRSVFIMNANTLLDVCPILLFAITKAYTLNIVLSCAIILV